MRCKGVKIILVYIVKIIGLSPLHKTDSLEPSFRRAQPHLQFGLGLGYTSGIEAKKQQHKNQKGKGSCGSADMHCPKRRLL